MINHKKILGSYRNDWYNTDFLELLNKRYDFKSKNKILDVGCGEYHWILNFINFFNQNAQITGIDINDIDAEILSGLQAAAKDTIRELNFIKSSSDKLPFDDESFDLVTCQTLMIHLENPLETLAEMKRVVKQGGLILISEPNNLAQAVFINSINIKESIDEKIHFIREKMKSDELKIESCQGNNSIGELIPVYLKQIGLENIQCYLNDKVTRLTSPYSSESEKRKIRMLKSLITDYPFKFSESEKVKIQRIVDDISSGDYWSYSPTMLFISSGIKG